MSVEEIENAEGSIICQSSEFQADNFTSQAEQIPLAPLESHFQGSEKLALAERVIGKHANWSARLIVQPVQLWLLSHCTILTISPLPLNNIWTDTQLAVSRQTKYMWSRRTKVIERCMLMTTDPGDLVLDPTCGSGTTAYVAEQWGRRWITIDTSRVAIALARTRLMAGRYPYYILSDSAEGRKEAEVDRHSAARPAPGDRRRHQKRLRLRTSAARHAQSHRQQRRDRRNPRPAGKLRWKNCGPRSTSCEKKWEEWEIPRQANVRVWTCERGVSPNIGTCAANASPKSTPPSPAAPTPNCSTTSPTKTTNACGSPAPSLSKASPRTVSFPPTIHRQSAGRRNQHDGFMPHDPRKSEKSRCPKHQQKPTSQIRQA